MKALKKYSQFYPPVLGLAGCFLPDARYSIGGSWYKTSLSGHYSGWGIVFLLLISFVYTINLIRKNSYPNRTFTLLTGIFITGFVLFRLYHTFILLGERGNDNLSRVLQLRALAGEGLLLLGFCGIWYVINSFRTNRDNFQRV